mgnify:CR=1 FL=1
MGSGMYLFLQAGDGIRGLVRSRGLGDVYKGQVCQFVHVSPAVAACAISKLRSTVHSDADNDADGDADSGADSDADSDANDDAVPDYVNPAAAAVPQEVGNSVTWDPDIVPPEISATAGSHFPNCKVVTSATAGSNPYEGYGVTSATAGCPDLDEDYDDMPELHHSDSEDVVPDDDEDEEGAGFWGSLKPPSRRAL